MSRKEQDLNNSKPEIDWDSDDPLGAFADDEPEEDDGIFRFEEEAPKPKPAATPANDAELLEAVNKMEARINELLEENKELSKRPRRSGEPFTSAIDFDFGDEPLDDTVVARYKYDLLQKEIDRPKVEVERLKDKLESAKLSVNMWKEMLDLAGREHERELAALRNQSVIPNDMIKRLIQLCHPDKHNGKKSAQEVTTWLISQK